MHLRRQDDAARVAPEVEDGGRRRIPRLINFQRRRPAREKVQEQAFNILKCHREANSCEGKIDPKFAPLSLSNQNRARVERSTSCSCCQLQWGSTLVTLLDKILSLYSNIQYQHIWYHCIYGNICYCSISGWMPSSTSRKTILSKAFSDYFPQSSMEDQEEIFSLSLLRSRLTRRVFSSSYFAAFWEEEKKLSELVNTKKPVLGYLLFLSLLLFA